MTYILGGVINLIKIIPPPDDISIQAKEYMKIPKNKSGIYKMYNKNDEIMYIGKASFFKTKNMPAYVAKLGFL